MLRNITAPFNNMRTLKFKIQPTVTLFTAVNHYSGPLRKLKRFSQPGQKVICCPVIGGFRSICRFLYFCGQSVVAVVMIDSSKKRISLVGVEVQSPYVIERRSKGSWYREFHHEMVFCAYLCPSAYVTFHFGICSRCFHLLIICLCLSEN